MDLSEQHALVPVSPARQPTLVYSPHPLLPVVDRRIESIPFLPGETIAAYLDRVGIRLRGPAVLTLNTVRVPREMWARTRPKPGMMITLRAAVAGGGGGGGKDPMRTVLTIALIAASAGAGAAAAGYFAQGAAAGSAWAAGGAAYMAVGAAVGGAVMVGGSLLINSLLAPPLSAFQ